MQLILVTSILPLYSPLHHKCSGLYSDFSMILERFRCFIQNASFTHIYIHTNTFCLRLTDCYHYWIGSNWGFNILPKDTLAHRLEPPGIKSPTFQLVNNLLQDIPTAGMSYCPDLRRFRLKAMRRYSFAAQLRFSRILGHILHFPQVRIYLMLQPAEPAYSIQDRGYTGGFQCTRV